MEATTTATALKSLSETAIERADIDICSHWWRRRIAACRRISSRGRKRGRCPPRCGRSRCRLVQAEEGARLELVADQAGPFHGGRGPASGPGHFRPPLPHNAAAGASGDDEEDAACGTCGSDLMDGDFAGVVSLLIFVTAGSLRAFEYCIDYCTTIKHGLLFLFAVFSSFLLTDTVRPSDSVREASTARFPFTPVTLQHDNTRHSRTSAHARQSAGLARPPTRSGGRPCVFAILGRRGGRSRRANS